MAEFLILNKDHWSKTASQNIKDTWTKEKKDALESAIDKWDIIEIRPDGNWKEQPGFNPYLCVIKVPELSMGLAKKYTEVWDDLDDKTIRGRRYSIVCTKQYETLTLSEFEARLNDKKI